jgi:hypothetical protein
MKWLTATLCGLLTAGWLSAGVAQQHDRSLFCRADADEVLILLDITTALDQRARDLLEDGVRQIVDYLEPGESLKVVTIADEVTHSELLLDDCVPYCPQDLGTIVLGNCTEGLLRLENRRLQNDLAGALRGRLQHTKDLPYSEIVRTLRAATQSRDMERALELYVFSDLIENSELIPGKEFWTTPATALLAKVESYALLPNLSHSSVWAFGIGRRGSGDRAALSADRMLVLERFWTAYFAAAGAETTTLSEFLVIR